MAKTWRRGGSHGLVLLIAGASVLGTGACVQLLGPFDFNGDPIGTGGSGTGGSGTGGDTSACSDGMRNGKETDTDCGGGVCKPCPDGKGCVVGSDCADKVCSAGACIAPSCTDQVQNGTETDVDCGGTCPPCAFGKACAQSADCKGMVCTNGTCQATCDDAEKDGAETATDCGGPMCTPCADSEACAANTDCQSGVCQTAKCAPVDVWSKSFDDASPNSENETYVAVDGADNVYLVGSLVGAVDFGGGPIDTMGDTLAYIAKFDKSGTYGWSTQTTNFGTGGEIRLHGAAADATGNVYTTGAFSAYFDVANANCDLTAPSGGQLSVVVLKMDPSGSPLWCNGYYDTTGASVGASIAVDSAGNVVVAGLLLQSTITFGSTTLTGSLYGDTFVLKLDPTGKLLWVTQFVATYGALPMGVAVDGTGNVVVTGHYGGSVTIGSNMLTTDMNDGNIYVAKLDATSGNPIWSKGFGAAADQPDSRVAVDAVGNIFLGGDFEGVVDFGGGPLTSMGKTDIFLAKLDPTGAYLWSKKAGDASAQAVTGLALDGKGQPVLVGNFQGTVDFGGGALVSTGGPMAGDNIYIAKFDTAGKHLWSRRFGDAHGQSINNVAIDSTGAAVITGDFKDTLDFGHNPMTNPVPGSADIFLAKLNTP